MCIFFFVIIIIIIIIISIIIIIIDIQDSLKLFVSELILQEKQT